MHFCTKELLTQIYEGQPGNIIETYRTGFVPSLYSGDIINLTEFIPDKKDKFICTGRVEYVLPLEYQELKDLSFHNKALLEIKRYNRKFHPKHWFFCIGIKLYPNGKGL